MKKCIIISVVLSLLGITESYAQWSERDSIRFKEMLDGHETIRLNLELPYANPSDSSGKIRYRMKPLPPPAFPVIIKSHPSITLPDTLVQLNLRRLSPSVFLLYTMKASLQEVTELKSCKLYEVYYPVPTADNGGVEVTMVFSAEDLLEYIFWKSARAKRHNAKHATAWKYYNTIP